MEEDAGRGAPEAKLELSRGAREKAQGAEAAGAVAEGGVCNKLGHLRLSEAFWRISTRPLRASRY